MNIRDVITYITYKMYLFHTFYFAEDY